MKKTLSILSLLMNANPATAMQCAFQKAKTLTPHSHIRAVSSQQGIMTQDFLFDPNQVLTMNEKDSGKTDKIPLCNYKHVIAYPKVCKTRGYSNIKIAIIDSGINFEHNLKKTTNLNFTKQSKNRFDDFLKKLPPKSRTSYHSLYRAHNQEGNHSIQVCEVLNTIVPGIELDLFALNHGEPCFTHDNISEQILSAIDHHPHFINISQVLNEGKHPLDHPFLAGDPIPTKTIDAFLEAKKKGIGIIFAAGNNNMDVMTLYPNLPELLKKMSGHLLICCGTAYNWMQGTSQENLKLVETRASFSNYFYDPKCLKYGISAPAEGLFCSHYPSDPLSGTSFAAPMVTASAAILKSTFPSLSALEIFDALKESSRKQPLFEEYTTFPHIPGVLHLTAALELAKNRIEIEKQNRS